MEYEKIVTENVNLIYHALKKLDLYKNYDEYFDIGMIGLVKGAKKYNKNLGYSISTYLMRCIQNEVLAYIRRENAYKTIPKKLIVSLNEKKKFLGDGEYELQDVVPSSFNLENYIENKNNVEKLYQCIKKLTEKEQIILIYSYGLFQKEKLRQKELSKILNISQAQVSRIRCKTIEKLRTMMDDDVI